MWQAPAKAEGKQAVLVLIRVYVLKAGSLQDRWAEGNREWQMIKRRPSDRLWDHRSGLCRGGENKQTETNKDNKKKIFGIFNDQDASSKSPEWAKMQRTSRWCVRGTLVQNASATRKSTGDSRQMVTFLSVRLLQSVASSLAFERSSSNQNLF